VTFAVSVKCPGCSTKIPLDLMDRIESWFMLDKPYCSEECANTHALSQDNVDTTIECPVCLKRQVEVGKTGKKRCVNDHVWENRAGVPMYLRDLTSNEIEALRRQGLHD